MGRSLVGQWLSNRDVPVPAVGLRTACVSKLSHAEDCVLFLVKSPDMIFTQQKSAHRPPLPTCLSVHPSLPAPSRGSKVASVGKKKNLCLEDLGCRAGL